MSTDTSAPDAVERLQGIVIERHGAVGVLRIDRPERFNSLDVATAQDLRKAGLRLLRDESIRCVVLAGNERAFCSGADLKYIHDSAAQDDFSYLMPASARTQSGYGAAFKQILEYIHSTISEIRRAPKPVVAAVKGVAAAGGFGLAMCCDLVYASESASFEWAYQKTSLTGAESSTFLLPRLVGLRLSMQLAFLNQRLSAHDALSKGLINDVWPDHEFDRQLMAVAQQLAAGPALAFAGAKALINEATGLDRIDAHLDKELRLLSRVADTPDFAEGIEAFLAKRAPRFGATVEEDNRT